MLVFPVSTSRPFPGTVRVRSTLSRNRLRLPFRVVGDMRMFGLHDRVVAHRLRALEGEVDVVHAWPLGARETLRAARDLGIPTVLERPNAHTRFAYEVVRRESERLGVSLPPDHEHAFNADVLQKEEEEYDLADWLLCPSDFVVATFLDQGIPREKLLRHMYGYDETRFSPSTELREPGRPFTMLFVGVAAVRKGLHFALEAWLNSPAHEHGVFQIAGDILPDYGDKLSSMLGHQSVHALGHRNDVPELMQNSDALILPSIEEGSPLTVMEALGTGCVPLVSDVCAGVCRDMQNALVHRVGDVETLARQVTMLHSDSALLARLRQGALSSARELTWAKAGERLFDVYREVATRSAQ
jgi:glycosyltransferase involved in cell wall biosynthesis